MHNLARKTFEPGVDEMLRDPIFKRLMETDKVEEFTLQALLRETAKDLQKKSHPLS